MDVPPFPQTFTATTPAQARLLLSLRAGWVLGALLGAGPLGAAEIARAVQQPLSRVHRTLRQLLSADLIVLAGVRPRAGRPVKLYAALAAAYEVPFRLSDAATLRELMATQYRPFFEAFLSHQAWRRAEQGRDTTRLNMDGQQLKYQIVRASHPPTPPDFYGLFAALNLTAAQAASLQVELRQLGEKYSQDGQDGQPHLLGLLLSPGELES